MMTKENRATYSFETHPMDGTYQLRGNSKLIVTSISISSKHERDSKQKDQHRRSVETLGLSGHGDATTIAGIS
jgi:hypothetical protein